MSQLWARSILRILIQRKNQFQPRRILFAMTLAVLVLFPFQNCEMTTQCYGTVSSGENNSQCVTKSNATTATRSTATTSSSGAVIATNSSTSGGTILGGGSGTSGGTSGSVLGGGSSGTTTGGGAIIGGGAGGSSGTPGGTTATGFRITSQPQNLEIQTDQYGSIYVSASGGTEPYSYQWYKDDAALTATNLEAGQFCSNTFNCGISADRYSKEGRYKVRVTDSKGQSIDSNPATISIADPTAGCAAGNYVSHSGANQYINANSFNELFVNSRGNYIAHSGNPLIQSFMYDYSTFGFVLAGNLVVGKDKEQRDFPQFCLVNIPHISEIANKNPGVPDQQNFFQCNANNMCGFHIEGKVTMECSYNKWKLVSSTCAWVADPPPPPPPPVEVGGA